VKKWDLDFITSADNLVEAKRMRLIDEYDGNKIWLDMLAKNERYILWKNEIGY
jgi:hypothetical protein